MVSRAFCISASPRLTHARSLLASVLTRPVHRAMVLSVREFPVAEGIPARTSGAFCSVGGETGGTPRRATAQVPIATAGRARQASNSVVVFILDSPLFLGAGKQGSKRFPAPLTVVTARSVRRHISGV